MAITASKPRENIYRILDQAIKTGVPVEIVRKGTILRIVPEKPASKLSRLKKRTGYRGDPDEITRTDWLETWTGTQWIVTFGQALCGFANLRVAGGLLVQGARA
jgi:hypothetical protein